MKNGIPLFLSKNRQTLFHLIKKLKKVVAKLMLTINFTIKDFEISKVCQLNSLKGTSICSLSIVISANDNFKRLGVLLLQIQQAIDTVLSRKT